MKQYWGRLSDKIDGLTLRERGLVFFSLAFVVLGILYTFLIRPALEQQRRITSEVSQRESQIRVMNQQLSLALTNRREDPDAANRRKLEDLKRKLVDVQRSLAERQARLIAADRMAGLLEDLVARNAKLHLLELKTLPPVRLEPGAAASASAAPKSGTGGEAPNAGGVYRHGVELTVQGGYFDLLSYVSQLEKLPAQIVWARVEVSSADAEYPKVKMKLTLYTLSLDRAWLVV
jgi:MSHA biogenesis protein MshJ